MKIHREATEVPALWQGAAKTNSFLYSSIWLNQILTLFAQVMTSEANGTNYDGYVRYRP